MTDPAPLSDTRISQLNETFGPETLSAQGTHNTPELFILGGGASGMMAVIALANALQNLSVLKRPDDKKNKDGNDELLRVVLVDQYRFGQGGIAYGQAGDQRWLNSTRLEMSPWNVEAFHDFCRFEKRLGHDPLGIEKRVLYQEFLGREYQKAIEKLKASNVVISEQSGYEAKFAATSTLIGNEYRNILLRNTQNNATTIYSGIPESNILAFPGYGGIKPYFRDFIDHPRFIASINPPGNLQAAIAQNANLIVVGGAAGVFDVIADIPEDYLGTVTIISPDGRLPDKRDLDWEREGDSVPYVDIFANIDPSNLSNARDLHEGIQLCFRQHEHDYSQRALAINAVRQIPDFLREAPNEIAQSFRKAYLHQYCRDATPVCPQVYDHFEALRDAGKIHVTEGRVDENNIALEDDKVRVHIEDTNHLAHYLVNCTGYDPLDNPLVESLLDLEIAQRDTIFPYALKSDEHGVLSDTHLCVIGPATNPGLDGIETFYAKIEVAVTRFLQTGLHAGRHLSQNAELHHDGGDEHVPG